MSFRPVYSEIVRQCHFKATGLYRRAFSQKPYYVTTPIFYPNADPHIGHLYSSVLADILVRYSRIKNPQLPAILVTGTNEHGSKIQRAATIRGLVDRELEFCDGVSQRFQDLASKANLNITRFIRTTEHQHAEAVSHLWTELKRRGYIYKDIHSGWYSISDECFYTPNQVEPVIDAVSGKEFVVSKKTGNSVEWMEEENYKFGLTAFHTQLVQRYNEESSSIVPIEQLRAIQNDLSDVDSMADISISSPISRLKWGIPVPEDPSHVIYVWLDALTSYLSAIGYPWSGPNYHGHSCGWPPDVQVIGKDILRFYAIYLPAFLLALDLPLPTTILSHAHWTIEQRKMSKSVGNVADPFETMEKYDPDVVRYYLARVGGRFNKDNDWSESQLHQHYQELFSLTGNQLRRVFSDQVLSRLPPEQRNVSITPDAFEVGRKNGPKPAGAGVHDILQGVTDKYEHYMDQKMVGDALTEVVHCLRRSDVEIARVQPWQPDTLATTVARVVTYTRETLRICGILLQPFIPQKAQLLLDALGVPPTWRTLADAKIGLGQSPDEKALPVQAVHLFPCKK